MKNPNRLLECDPQLIKLFKAVDEVCPIVIIEGKRTKERQEHLLKEGKSKTSNSKHLREPSEAVDVAPDPVDWNDLKRFYFLAGVVMATARQMGIRIRFGGDWDMDGDFSDNKFNDLVHYELI